MRSATRKQTGKDPRYLAWLRTQPCVACAAASRMAGRVLDTPIPTPYHGPTEAAHVGARGLSQKCPDRQAIPLCAFHHRTGPHACHRLGKRFWTLFALDPDAVIREHGELYLQENPCRTL